MTLKDQHTGRLDENRKISFVRQADEAIQFHSFAL